MVEEIEELKKEMRDVYVRLRRGEFNEEITKRIYEICRKVQKYNDEECKYPELEALLTDIFKELNKALDRGGKTEVSKVDEMGGGEIRRVSDGLFVVTTDEGVTIIQLDTKSKEEDDIFLKLLKELRECDEETLEELKRLSKEELDKLVEKTYYLFPEYANICPAMRRALAVILWLRLRREGRKEKH